MKTTVAPKKSGKANSRALVPWVERFAPYAKKSQEQVAKVGGGVAVRFGHGKITAGGVDVPGGKLQCIILDSCAFNGWYGKKYDKDDVQPPDCYAFAIVVGDPEMAPHAEAPDKQCEFCADCEKNQFGTADTGRGKACGNNVRLGLLLAKDIEDGASVAAAEMATAKVSPTNLKRWAGYVKSLDELDGGARPPWGVVTEISCYDDSETQIRVEFKLVETIDDPDILDALEARLPKVQDELQRPFAPPTEKPARGKKPAGKPAAGAGRKFAARGR